MITIIDIYENWRLKNEYEYYFQTSLEIPIWNKKFKRDLFEKIFNNYCLKRLKCKNFKREKIYLKNEINESKELKFDFKYGPIIITSLLTLIISLLTISTSFWNNLITKSIDVQIKNKPSPENLKAIKSGIINFINILPGSISNIIIMIFFFILGLSILYSFIDYFTKKIDVLKIYFYSLCLDIINELDE